MIEKYILYGEKGEVIAIKWNDIKEIAIIGGNTRFKRFMITILNEYFKKGLRHAQQILTQKNKVRFVFKTYQKRFDLGLTKLQKHGFNIEQVSLHERIMR